MNVNHIIELNTEKYADKPRTVGTVTPVRACPFCEMFKGNNDNVILDMDGSILWVENKYPLLSGTYQTVLVETDNCEQDLTNYSLEYAVQLFEYAFRKRRLMLNEEDIREVLFFKNHGLMADSSIHHAHMQLVGLKEAVVDKKAILNSLSGYEVHKSEELIVTISEEPIGEFYEFNISWEIGSSIVDAVKWIQRITRYCQYFKSGVYDGYNLAFYEIGNRNCIKVIPRKPVSIYLLGYGLKQVPNDFEKVASEILADN